MNASIQEREKKFRRDLQELLLKHNANLNITDDGKPYGMHRAICVVELEGRFDNQNGDILEPYVEFIL